MYKEDLALNNLEWLIDSKTKPKQINWSIQRIDALNMIDIIKYTRQIFSTKFEMLIILSFLYYVNKQIPLIRRNDGELWL